MKIEKLNEDKIRIILNMEDLRERNIDFHSFMSNSIDSQEIFFDMLNKADEEVGFDTENCRITIEALALSDGHFILTITKSEHKNEAKSLPPAKKNLQAKRKTPPIDYDKMVFSFASFDAVCDFCIFLKDTCLNRSLKELAISSDLYEYNSNFYLILNNINMASPDLDYITSSASEFAHFINCSSLFEKKVKEYGKLVIQDSAIFTCMKYFT